MYVSCGFDSTIVQDIERVYFLRDMGYLPYIMIYGKYDQISGDTLNQM